LTTLTVIVLLSGSAQVPPTEQTKPRSNQDAENLTTDEVHGPILRFTSRLVQLSVLVHNKRGSPIGDLTRDEITIFDNGKPQRLAIFSQPTVPTVTVPKPTSSLLSISNRDLRRTDRASAATIILLDTLNMRSPDELLYVKRELPNFL